MNAYVGTIMLFGGLHVPKGWYLCDGRELTVQIYRVLFSVIGTTYGGNGETTFKLPDLRKYAPIEGTKYIIAYQGEYPSPE